MKEFKPFLKTFLSQWKPLSYGVILSLITLIASISLITLSGWFLTSCALAGLLAISFNYLLPSAGVRFFATTKTASRWGDLMLTHDALFKVTTKIRIHIFSKLIPITPNQNLNFKRAELLNRMILDVKSIEVLYINCITPLFISSLSILVMCYFLTFFSLQLAIYLLLFFLCFITFFPCLFHKLSKEPGSKVISQQASLRFALLEWLKNRNTIEIYGLNDSFKNNIYYNEKTFYKTQRHLNNVSVFSSSLMIATSGIILFLVLWFLPEIGKNLTPSLWAMFTFAALAIFEAFNMIPQAFMNLEKTKGSASRINQIINSRTNISFPNTNVNYVPKYLDKISFLNVSFKFNNSKHLVLKKINMKFSKGQHVAIVGKTGVGKSTILNLLNRFLEPTEGCILLDNLNINEVSEKQLRSTFSVISQNIDIMNDTLANNLRLAKPNATDDELLLVLKKVQLDYIFRTKDDLEIWVGEQGRQLSGGERRRVGIARSLLQDTPVIIMDEPTEGLDTNTEDAIFMLLKDTFKLKTILYITHKLNHIDYFDTIIMLKDGRIFANKSNKNINDVKAEISDLLLQDE